MSELRDYFNELERERLREDVRAFSEALGYGDGRTEPAATLAELIEPLSAALAAARDHDECPVRCELCGEMLAATTCERCHGGGCLPNPQLAYLECGECAGVGKVHVGCAEQSYAELVERVKVAEAAVVSAKADGWDERDRARASYLGPDNGHYEDCMGWEDCNCATYPNPYRALDGDA